MMAPQRRKLTYILLTAALVIFSNVRLQNRSRSVLPDTYLRHILPPGTALDHPLERKMMEERPVMHTFFQRIDPSKKGTGMSDEADIEMIENWKKAWTAAGWTPKVLDLSDAKRHPDFEDYSKSLQEVPMMGIGGKGVNRFYNQLCFYRWLAMAASGGGWMCDYDVFPLQHLSDDIEEFPNDGEFTVYDGNFASATPSLMSGKPEEWTRMAHLILAVGLDHKNLNMWTDNFSLIELLEVPGAYRLQPEVIGAALLMTGKKLTNGDCAKTNGKMAVHFSHKSLVLGSLRKGETTEHRPKIVTNVLRSWSLKCTKAEEEKTSAVET